MTARGACAFFMYGVDRVAAARRAVGLVFEVAIGAEQVLVRRGGGFRLLRLERPTELGRINVFPVDAANALARRFDGLSQVGDRDAREQSNDGHDHHDLNEGEAGASVCFHSAVLTGLTSDCSLGLVGPGTSGNPEGLNDAAAGKFRE